MNIDIPLSDESSLFLAGVLTTLWLLARVKNHNHCSKEKKHDEDPTDRR